MNHNNYCTLEMSRRLVEAGVKIETECLWVGLKAFNEVKYKIVTLNTYERESYLFDQQPHYPAPSMADLWAMLPDNTCIMKNNGETYITDENCEFSDTNPCDALAELLIWVKGRKG